MFVHYNRLILHPKPQESKKKREANFASLFKLKYYDFCSATAVLSDLISTVPSSWHSNITTAAVGK